jgi:hypothetical protein
MSLILILATMLVMLDGLRMAWKSHRHDQYLSNLAELERLCRLNELQTWYGEPVYASIRVCRKFKPDEFLPKRHGRKIRLIPKLQLLKQNRINAKIQ